MLKGIRARVLSERHLSCPDECRFKLFACRAASTGPWVQFLVKNREHARIARVSQESNLVAQ
jgi:hypothetical protein